MARPAGAAARPGAGRPATGWPREAVAAGLPWQEPDGGWRAPGRDRPAHRDRHRGPAHRDPQRFRRRVRRLGRAPRERLEHEARPATCAAPDRRGRRAPRCGPPSATRPASPTPGAGPDARRRPGRWTRCAALADDLRRDVVGDDVTYVVNRNINFTNVCYTGCRFCAFAQRRTDADAFTLSLDEVGNRAEEAWARRRHRGLHAGRHPPRPAGHRVLRPRRRGQAAGAASCTSTRSPRWRSSTAPRRTGLSIRDWLIKAQEAGLDSIPGTAAEILDDDVRWILTKGKLPTATWIEVVTTAHQVGLRSSFDDDVRARRHPGALGRAPAGAGPDPGRDRRFHRVRAAAVRAPELADLPGRGRAGRARPAGQPRGARDGPAAAARPDRQHPDAPGSSSASTAAARCCGRGERPRRHADGGDHLPDGRLAARVAEVRRRIREIAAGAGRQARQRDTLYGELSAERLAASAGFDEHVARLLPLVGGS